MAADGSHARRLHTARSAAHHQHLPRLGRLGDGQFFLPAHRGVDDAGEGFKREPHAEASLPAAGARGDVLEATGFGLVGEFRVGDERPPHHDAIGVAFDQDVISEPGVGDLAHHQNRRLGDLLDGRGLRHVRAWRHPHAGQDPERVIRVHPAGDLEGIDSGCFQLGHHVAGVQNARAAGNMLVARYAQDDGEVLPRFPLDVVHHFQNELQTAVYRAAVFVGALVAQRRQERTAHHVAMGGVEFHAIAAGFPGAPGRIAVLLDDLLDFFQRQLTGHLSVPLAHYRRRRHRLHPAYPAKRLRAGVADLRRHLGAEGVHGIHPSLEAGDEAVVPQSDALHDVRMGLVDDHRLEYEQPRPALGPLPPVVDHLVGHCAVVRRPGGRHRGHDDPVLEFHGADLERTEELPEVRCHWSSSPLVVTEGTLARIVTSVWPQLVRAESLLRSRAASSRWRIDHSRCTSNWRQTRRLRQGSEARWSTSGGGNSSPD